MAKFRQLKAELRERLLAEGWQDYLASLASEDPQEYIGPMMALLPQGGLIHWRAISGMGTIVPALARARMEDARVVLRRLMWHMNEESGNIGWGIAESMGEILGHSPPLASEFSRVMFSYILDSGRDDNYVDHPPLLRGCFWGAGRLAQLRPDLAGDVPPRLVAGLGHEDVPVQGQAALALIKALNSKPNLADALSAELVAEARVKLGKLASVNALCEDYDGERILALPASVVAEKALGVLEQAGGQATARLPR